MVIDPRRDHSFRIPRPALSSSIGAPDACTQCHQDQSQAWAQDQISQWNGGDADGHFGEVIAEAETGSLVGQANLLALALDDDQASIVRATAMTLLDGRFPVRIREMLKTAATDDDPIVRMGAAQAGRLLPVSDRVPSVGRLLRDPVKAVRMEAVSTLLDVPDNSFSQGRRLDFQTALEEYTQVQRQDADRPEAQMNLARIMLAKGQTRAAAEHYQTAIRQQPSFSPSYLNLADLYRRLGQEDRANRALRAGLEVNGDDADLHHALGLSLVRQNNPTAALDALRKSFELAPDQPRYAYVFAIALNTYADSVEALSVLTQALERWPDNYDLLVALSTLSRDNGQLDQAQQYASTLLRLYPDDPTAQQLVQELGRR